MSARISLTVAALLLSLTAHARMLRGGGTTAPANAARPLGAVVLFFSNQATSGSPRSTEYDNWIAAPTAGVTGISLAGAPATNPTETAKIAAHGLSYFFNANTDCGSNPTGCQAEFNTAISVGADHVWENEFACSAGTDATNWAASIAYWQAHAKSGALIGISSGDLSVPANCISLGANVTLGQEESFDNSPVTSPPFPAGVHSNVLMYGSHALCDNQPPSDVSHVFQTLAFWDVDGFGLFANQVNMYADWLQQAETVAASGIAAQCNLPWTYNNTSLINPLTFNASFTMGPYLDFKGWTNNAVNQCEYRVFAGTNVDLGGPNSPGTTITRDWTPRTCEGISPTITVGSGGDCPISTAPGSGVYTCLVVARAHDSVTGNAGSEQYTELVINF